MQYICCFIAIIDADLDICLNTTLISSFIFVHSSVELTGERFETDSCNCQLENVACVFW